LNIFGSYSPENNNKDTIVAIFFSPEDKTINYFIQFAKYQNKICWNNKALQKVVKDTILTRISKELHFSKEDLFIFKELKWTVIKVNNNY